MSNESKISRRSAIAAAAAAGISIATAREQDGKVPSKRRVAIVADTKMHMGPWVARELAGLNHDLVIADPADGLPQELRGLGAKVEVVDGAEDLTKHDSVQKMVKRAQDVFGRFDCACIRTGIHGTGDIFAITQEDLNAQVAGNMLSVVYALQALLPPLQKQKSGQVVINTSASGERLVPIAAAYSSTRAGANALIRCAASTVAKDGVCVNATGTNFMNYPSFLHDVGADKDPSVVKELDKVIPLGRLGEPREAAHFAVSLLDGKNAYQTGNFFPISGGYSNV